jgi:hypothetical protein
LRPRKLYADAAYDTEHIRNGLESIGIEPNIPVNTRNGWLVGKLEHTILSYIGR